eukprot:1365086-Amorphochlora_amoeboformis.AAC.1
MIRWIWDCTTPTTCRPSQSGFWRFRVRVWFLEHMGFVQIFNTVVDHRDPIYNTQDTFHLGDLEIEETVREPVLALLVLERPP